VEAGRPILQPKRRLERDRRRERAGREAPYIRRSDTAWRSDTKAVSPGFTGERPAHAARLQRVARPDYPTCRRLRRHEVSRTCRGTGRAEAHVMATVETIVAFALIFATMSRIFVSPKQS
jgi:hypothetical protein